MVQKEISLQMIHFPGSFVSLPGYSRHTFGCSPHPVQVTTKTITLFCRGSLITFIFHWHPGKGASSSHSQTKIVGHVEGIRCNLLNDLTMRAFSICALATIKKPNYLGVSMCTILTLQQSSYSNGKQKHIFDTEIKTSWNICIF